MNKIIMMKEQSILLEQQGVKITLENGDTYYCLPFFYKKLEENVFEIITRKKLPDEIEEIINPCRL